MAASEPTRLAELPDEAFPEVPPLPDHVADALAAALWEVLRPNDRPGNRGKAKEE